jgi:hypothetical protein
LLVAAAVHLKAHRIIEIGFDHGSHVELNKDETVFMRFMKKLMKTLTFLEIYDDFLLSGCSLSNITQYH